MGTNLFPVSFLRPSATPSFTPTPSTTPTPTRTLTPTATPTLTPTPTPVPAVRITSADHALFNGDWEKALDEYQSAHDSSSDPDIQAAALLGIGRTYYQVGDYWNALDSLRKLINQFPKARQRPDAFYFQGLTYDALLRYGDAADSYHNFLALRPGLIDAYVFEKAGDSSFNAGDYGTALADYQAAVQSPRLSEPFGIEAKMARSYALTGDYATAIYMYKDIYSRSQDDAIKARIDLLLGNTYMAIQETDNAYTAYLDAVQNYPVQNDAYQSLIELINNYYPVNDLDRGLVDYFAGQDEIAIDAFNRYIATAGGDMAVAYYYKGLALDRQKDYVGAIEAWDTVITNYPASGVWDNAWEQKGYTQWYSQGKTDDGIATLTGFVATAPGHTRAAEFLYDAGRAAEYAGDLKRSIKLWERVPVEFPASDYAFKALFRAGISRYRLEDYSGAQASFTRLAEMARGISQRSQALFWIGKAQKASGNADASKATWQQAASTDPTGYYSERSRDILVDREPFATPIGYDLNFDLKAEKEAAEAWVHDTFKIPAEVNLSDPGPLLGEPRLVRGAELWQLGEYNAAVQEFESLRASYAEDPANSYRLMNYLLGLGSYRSAILSARQVLSIAGMDDAATLNAPPYFNHIRFGAYYADLIVPAAQAYSFHPLLLFAVARQESMFEGYVDSSAGAQGLFQIMPVTGRGIAALNSWPANYTDADLYRPLVSVTFGAAYLHDQKKYLAGDLYAALAAYNGGPGNADQWKQQAKGDPDLFLEIVRFDETHRYITSIYEIYTIYRQIYGR